MPYIAKRIICFLAGIAVESFGIALITKSNLGTSPISSIAWVTTLRFPQISFGITTFAVNIGIGTIIAAVITGMIVNFFNRHLRFVAPAPSQSSNKQSPATKR